MKWWSRRVPPPYELACRASALLVCHDPNVESRNPKSEVRMGWEPWHRIGRLPRCRPESAEFWRLCRVLTRSLLPGGLMNRKSEITNGMVRLPGVAPGHPPWRGDILLLNHSRRKVKGPEASLRFRPMPFQQRTNTSCYLAIPTHGFTVVLSVFRGTPPAKPLDCKIRPNSSGALSRDPWADPTGGEPRLSRAFLCFVPGDII